jgi:predicted transcriptional regulator
MDPLFNSTEKRKIYNILLKHPGLHLTKISTLLNIPIVVVEHHLKELEKDHIVISRNDSGYSSYYITEQQLISKEKRTNETQNKILNLIQQNPGLHLSKIAELMNMRLSLAQYHLHNLERKNVINSETEDGYKRFYSKDSGVGSREKQLLSILRRKTPLKIVLFLLKNGPAKHKEILKIVNISPSTLTYHLNSLVEYDILEVQSYGEEKGYRICNRREVLSCLLNHVVLDGFKELWDDFKIG